MGCAHIPLVGRPFTGRRPPAAIAGLTNISARDHNGHMKVTANVAQLKARLSEYLRQVRGGAELVVTERGVPIARLVPLEDGERRQTRRDRLVRAGVLRPGRGQLRKGLQCPPQGAATGAGVLEALLEERANDPR